MTVSHVICDRCGAEILDARTLLKVKVSCGPLLRHGLDRIDLCSSCAANLMTWLKAAPPAGEGPCADA